MQNTTHFGLNLVEGTDVVNPLVQDVPNYETIDDVMYDNSTKVIGGATELLNGTVHALTRINPDTNVFKFVATSNWTAGDTVTLDGQQVTALLPSGETLASGAYVINATVLCALNGTVLTFMLSGGSVTTADDALMLGGQLPEYYGTAQDVADAKALAQASQTVANNANNKANSVGNQLEFGSTKFYFDYQNGKYGFNTEATRGADTFNPFSDGDIKKITYNSVGTYACPYYEYDNDDNILTQTWLGQNTYNTHTVLDGKYVTITYIAGGSYDILFKKDCTCNGVPYNANTSKTGIHYTTGGLQTIIF